MHSLIALLLPLLALGSLVEDRRALLSLRASVNDPRGYLRTWQENATSVCAWRGVSCDLNLSSVVALNLSYFGLSGQLPSSFILNLPLLETLSLSGNNLAGPIPQFSASQPSSSSLQVVLLGDNSFSGAIPPSLGSQANLRKLDLQNYSQLRSLIPKQLCRLTKLQFLSLASTRLHGSIPPCLGGLSNLLELYLHDNQLTGSIPAALSRLNRLTSLDLSRNELSGAIPAELGSLANLSVLYLWRNQLTGALPPQLGRLSSLTIMDISINRLQGVVPDEYAMLRSLTQFRVYNNSLSGSFPGWLAASSSVTDIMLTMNSFSGVLPQSLGSSSALNRMDISANSFTGPVPPQLCSGGALQFLVLADNKFSGELPAGVQQCRCMVRLRLENNTLSGSINLSMPLLNVTTLHHNAFNGTLSIASSMLSLAEMDVSFNKLQGELPSTLGSLRSLSKLNLASNRFSGQIPSGLGSLRSLVSLDISSNNLSGGIPSSLTSCGELVTLGLSRNRLSGGLSVITGLIKISQVDASHNRFTGPLPEAAPTLEDLNLSYNNLSGPIPSSLSKLQLNVTGNPLVRGDHRKAGKSGRARRRSRLQTAAEIAAPTITVFLLICTCFCLKVSTECSKIDPVKERPWEIISYQNPPLPLSELVNGIDDENLVARSVYRVHLSDGRQVAVKRLEGNASNTSRAFNAEVNVLGQLRHRNIVKLLASCSNGTVHLIVYEYMPKGNLRTHLHQLDWKTRLQIIISVAQGLLYLHEHSHLQVVHRDVKCENILLSSEMEAQLGDFGFAKLLEAGKKLCTVSTIAGSFGYIAPECAYTWKVGVEADVYSFGMVMLELVTDKDAWFHKDGMNLVEWVKSELPEVLEQQALEIGADVCSYRCLLSIALACLCESRSIRPTMRSVLIQLQQVSSYLKEPESYHGVKKVMDIHHLLASAG